VKATLYEEDGHRYTTFVVARLAGWDVAPALELSWGSQFPDKRLRLEAIPAAFRYLWDNQAPLIMEVLHSLHGGDQAAVTKRRQALRNLIKTYVSQWAPWEVGIMIHAFGDSYAHTKGQPGHEKAYPSPTGHLPDGHDPDSVVLHPQKYLTYVEDLYACLVGAGTQAASGVDPIRKLVGALTPDSDYETVISAYAIDALGLVVSDSEAEYQRLKPIVKQKRVMEILHVMQDAF